MIDRKLPCSLCPLWLDLARNEPSIDTSEGIDGIDVMTILLNVAHD